MTANAVSVIVPTIGRPESLTRLLDSLARQSRRPDEVIVSDGSLGPEVERVVAQPAWAARGLNVRRIAVQPPNAVSQRVAAIADSHGEFLLLIDDDVVLEPECVEALWSAMARDPKVAGALADFNNQTWPEPTRAWRLYMRYVLGLPDRSWQGQVVGPLLRFGYSPPPNRPTPIAWLATSNTMIRRAAYDHVGGFSTFFLHRCTINEDVDLGLKIAKVGTIVFCPAARMSHFHDPGGRVSPAVAAEDDLYNRYLVMHRTQGRSAPSAFAQVLLFFAVETVSNLGGAALRLHGNGFGSRLGGRLRAIGRILVSPFRSPARP